MSALIEQLKRFNRKERFFLVGLALDKPDFALGDGFRSSLEHLLPVSIPADAFVAMDYHLEWLFAAVRGAQVGQRYSNADEFVKGNQEDIDLLVAFDEGKKAHLILLEAKGDTAWSNKQMQSKVDRLTAVFNGADSERVEPHFVFVSRRPPQHLKTGGWPPWIDVHNHLEMRVSGDLKVTRCDVEGNSNKGGEYWMIEQL